MAKNKEKKVELLLAELYESFCLGLSILGDTFDQDLDFEFMIEKVFYYFFTYEHPFCVHTTFDRVAEDSQIPWTTEHRFILTEDKLEFYFHLRRLRKPDQKKKILSGNCKKLDYDLDIERTYEVDKAGGRIYNNIKSRIEAGNDNIIFS